MEPGHSSEQENRGTRIAGVLTPSNRKMKDAREERIREVWGLASIYDAFPPGIRPVSLGISAVQLLKSIACRIPLATAQQKFMDDCTGPSGMGTTKIGFQSLSRIQAALLEEERRNGTQSPSSKGSHGRAAPTQSQFLSTPPETLHDPRTNGLSASTKYISFAFKDHRVVSCRRNENLRGASSSRRYDTVPSAHENKRRSPAPVASMCQNKRRSPAPVASMCQRPQVQWIDLSTPRQTPEDSAPEDSTPGSFTIVNPGFGGNLASSQSSKGPVPTSRHALGEKERNGATVEKSGAGVHAHGTEPVVQVKVLSKGKPRPTSTGFGSGTGSGTIRQTKAAGGGKLDGIPKKTGKENEAAKTPSTRPHGPAAKNRQNSTPSLSRAGTSGTDALRVSFKIPNVSARKSAESSITSVTTDAAEAAEDPGPKVQVGKKAPGDPTGSRPVTSSVPNPSQSTKESVKVDQNKARHANNSGELDSSTLVDLDLQTSAQDSVSSGAEVPLAAPVRPAEADSQPSINGSRSQEETTSSAAEAPLAVPVRPAEADSQPSINDSRSQEETTSSAAVEARLAKSIEPQATSDVKDNKHVTRAGLKGSEDKPSPSESTPHGKATEAVRPRQDDALAMDLDRNNAPQSMDPNLPSKSLKLSTEVEELTPERMIADIESKIAMWAKRGGEETTRDLKRKATGTISPARVKASRPNPASPPSPISITSKENTPTTFFSGSELQMTEEKPKTNAETLMAKFRNAVKLLEQTRLEIKDADINEGKNEEVQLKQGLENSMDCMIRHGEGDLEMEVDRYERDTEQKLGF